MDDVKKRRIYLIDGHSYAYRAFHAIRELTDSRGMPLNAVYGFTRMLLKLIRDEQPEYIAVAFDSPSETFRHKVYEEYKATRAEQPEGIRHQIPLIKEVVDAFNISSFELPGYEADDVLATLAEKAVAKGVEAVIVTADKDMLQLVSKRVKVLHPHKENFVYDPGAVSERFGVGPEKMRDLLAMTGDSIDNIPGVPGVGPKTAADLLNKYGSLEGVFEHIGEISGPKRRENLRLNKDQAFISRDLVTVVCDAPLQVDIDACKLRKYNTGKLLELFRQFEFRTLINEIIEVEEKTDADYKVIDERRQLEELIEALTRAGRFAFDFETTSQDPMKARLVGISVAYEPEAAFYIPVGHVRAVSEENKEKDETELFDEMSPKQLDAELVLNELKPLLEDETIKKTGQNIKYEMVILARHGIELRGIEFDTMVAAYLLNPSKPNYNLDEIALEYLNYRKIPLEKLIGKGAGQITMARVGVRAAAAYSCEDSDITLRLREELMPLLKEKKLHELFENIELPLIKALARMELCGVRVDLDALHDLSARIQTQLEALEGRIYSMTGREFNISSTQQLGKILFEELNLPTGRKTKTGYSTDVAVLERLATEHELPKKVLEYRMLSKLKSTYVDAFPNLVNPQTGRIHTSFNQAVTSTGRLSSSEPNLQNIPIRSGIGREIRKAFIPRDDQSVLMSADYSQIELRILAELCGDEVLCRAFREGEDIHDQTSSKIFQAPIERVTPEMRRKAKIANYGILYGISAARLAFDLGIGVEEAQEFIDNYFKLFPKVKHYIDGVIEQARRNGYVTTIMNRRRYIPDIDSQNFGVRRFAERTAINTPIQGSAADLIKAAMIRIDERIGSERLRSEMLLQVHDELLFDAPLDEMEPMKSMVKEIMETAYPLSVPLVADVSTGRNWLEAHD